VYTGSFCQDKFLVCLGIIAKKAHSDSEVKVQRMQLKGQLISKWQSGNIFQFISMHITSIGCLVLTIMHILMTYSAW